jgi:hypothetical protein
MDGLGGMINKLSLASGISFGNRLTMSLLHSVVLGLSAVAFSSINVNVHVLTLYYNSTPMNQHRPTLALHANVVVLLQISVKKKGS